MARVGLVFLDTGVLLHRLESTSAPPFMEFAGIRTGILNLVEVVHYFLRKGNERAAMKAFEALAPVADGFDRRRVFETARVRVRFADRGLSYADAALYALAREAKAPLVTRDSGFRGLPGVVMVTAKEA